MLLAVESSCDESALALFDPSVGVTGEWVHSQIALHEAYGGVVPDLASRQHLEQFTPLLREAFAALEKPLEQVVVTRGPGLAGCLALGMALARAVAMARGLPLSGVNHLRGHAFSPFMEVHREDPGAFSVRLDGLLPHLGLIVSGGNTLLFTIEPDRSLHLLGETVDDAAGEALDKGARLLGFPYPGGARIEAVAREGGEAARHSFPRALTDKPGAGPARFSFSGLKTSLRYRLEAMSDAQVAAELPHLCASYQAAVVDQLTARTRRCVEAGAGRFRSLGLSGGVSNNAALRAAFGALAAEAHLPLLLAEPRHTGDNAAMIAFAAWCDMAGLERAGPGGALTLEPALRLV
jgi:N6-L-threonylcarbamoyladenine synthase